MFRFFKCKNKRQKLNIESTPALCYTNNSSPIKVVVKDSHTLGSSVKIGKGASTQVIGLPLFNRKRNNMPRRPYRVLLDSGSDGDILFVRKDTSDVVPTTKRIRPQKWKTSAGVFTTYDQGDQLEFSFPEFNESKTFITQPDIVYLEKSKIPPTYDLILGVETLTKLGAILNFQELSVTINQQTLPMKSFDQLRNFKDLREQMKAFTEPASTRQATSRVSEILDAKYEKANLPSIVESATHLTTTQRAGLLKALQDYEELFDGTLGDWKTKPVSLKLKEGVKPYHGRPYPVPQKHLGPTKRDVERLVKIGVLKRQPDSEWASPAFIVPKKNQTVRSIADLREVNKRIVRHPFPIPKISSMLQDMEGFTYATSLDLNMGYYTIRLDPDAQKICTVIFPWGKYSYLRLPMGIACAPDIFQEKMSGLMATLEWIKVYLDDLLIITRGNFEDHLDKLRQVLQRLQDAGLRVNADKSIFGSDEVEYLGYVLTRNGIKPQREKVSAILALTPPKSVKDLRKFLGMVQYYRDLWKGRSHLLAPLSDLVGECGHTKATRKNNTKKKKWYWTDEHQKAYDDVKKAIARDVLLAYPNYSEVFEIYTDASSRQLGAVITQNNRILAFFSRKLSDTQKRYSVTELELLSIVECLKEFKGMLWGQRIKVFTDHKNLIQDALGLASDRVYRWRLLLEEYGPEIVYIKGIDNTVADAISRLEYNPDENIKDMSLHSRNFCIAKLFTHLSLEHGGDDVTPTNVSDDTNSKETFSQVCEGEISSINDLFATTTDDEEEVYPLTISEIAQEQRRTKLYKPYFNAKTKRKEKKETSKALKSNPKSERISLRVIGDEKVLVYDETRLVIPNREMQLRAIDWYHHYLQHPGHTRLEETISSVMYWKTMRSDIRNHVKRCSRCQKGKKRRRKYGKLPPKIAITTPWQCVCVDLIGPYTLKDSSGSVILDFMCLTMIDPATGWFEIIELPTTDIKFVRKGEEIVDVILDKSSACISRLFNKQWLSRYPRPTYVIYDNGSEFKLHFRALCESYSIKRKPTTIKNPQANAILERTHGVFADMMRTSGIDGSDDLTPQTVDDFITDAAWAIRSTHHTVLRSTPGAAVFGRDMLFDIPYLADWTEIGRRRQQLVDRDTERSNKKRIDYDYKVGDKVTIRKDGNLRKAEDKNTGPYTIIRVHCNGNVRIQRGSVTERINIRRIDPYYE